MKKNQDNTIDYINENCSDTNDFLNDGNDYDTIDFLGDGDDSDTIDFLGYPPDDTVDFLPDKEYFDNLKK